MSNDGVNKTRRNLIALTTVVGAGGAVGVAVPFVGSWQPSARAKAAGAPVKVNISKIEPGQMITVEWRGKPVFILRRTADVLANIKKLDAVVADPSSAESVQPESCKNEYRSIKDEFLIVLGLCTHLGCAPKHRPEVGTVTKDWLGGFFCPCHGSMFDLAGRVFKGVPAPTNLEVPPYSYLTDAEIIIGVEEGAA
ncbi:MAG: ubiquinol-cytochrome c reductase iron-sulfur subunit [Pseudomonadales bacterium]|nr:ubiquinol-cytochrome c reductase iron-sulfur subunit [Pseudomonadales bacterium]